MCVCVLYMCSRECCKNQSVLCLWFLPVVSIRHLICEGRDIGYCVLSPVSNNLYLDRSPGLFSTQRGPHWMPVPGSMNVLLQEGWSKSITPDVENLHLKKAVAKYHGHNYQKREKSSEMSVVMVVYLIYYFIFATWI